MKKLVLFLMLFTVVLLATVAFAGDVATVPAAASPALPGWLDWLLNNPNTVAYYAVAAMALGVSKKIKANDPICLGLLLMYRVLGGLLHKLGQIPEPPDAPIINKLVTGPTKIETAAEAMGGTQ